MPSIATTSAILCLHGYGTNGAILRLQLRNLGAALEAHGFHLIFPDAPFIVSMPGPGAMPAFADGPRPFRRWHTDATLSKLFGVSDTAVQEEQKAVRKLLRDAVSRVEEEGGGQIVGVLGFSQGVGLAAGLCLDADLAAGIKFAVCVCGLYPALAVTDNAAWLAGRKEGRKIDIPSIHVMGTEDSWKGQGEKVMNDYFVPEKARKIECKISHEIPSRPKDVAVVVDEVIKAWGDAGAKPTRQT